MRFITEVAGRAGDGADRARRGQRDHQLPRGDADQRAAGERDRPLPGGGADLEALCLHGAAVGADQDRVDRRDGRAGVEHPRGREGARGDAHPAAQQRRGERGVAGGPVAVRLGRAAGGSGWTGRTCARAGGCAPATWGEAFEAVAAAVKGKQVAGLVGDLVSGRGGLRAEGAGREPGRDGGVPHRRGGAAGGEPVGLCRDGGDRRHRRGEADPAGRDQPAARGAGAERAHPQGLD